MNKKLEIQQKSWKSNKIVENFFNLNSQFNLRTFPGHPTFSITPSFASNYAFTALHHELFHKQILFSRSLHAAKLKFDTRNRAQSGWSNFPPHRFTHNLRFERVRSSWLYGKFLMNLMLIVSENIRKRRFDDSSFRRAFIVNRKHMFGLFAVFNAHFSLQFFCALRFFYRHFLWLWNVSEYANWNEEKKQIKTPNGFRGLLFCRKLFFLVQRPLALYGLFSHWPELNLNLKKKSFSRFFPGKGSMEIENCGGEFSSSGSAIKCNRVWFTLSED